MYLVRSLGQVMAGWEGAPRVGLVRPSKGRRGFVLCPAEGFERRFGELARPSPVILDAIEALGCEYFEEFVAACSDSFCGKDFHSACVSSAVVCRGMLLRSLMASARSLMLYIPQDRSAQSSNSFGGRSRHAATKASLVVCIAYIAARW